MFPIKAHHETTVVGKFNFLFLEALFYSLRSGRVCLAAIYRGLVLVHMFGFHNGRSKLTEIFVICFQPFFFHLLTSLECVDLIPVLLS